MPRHARHTVIVSSVAMQRQREVVVYPNDMALPQGGETPATLTVQGGGAYYSFAGNADNSIDMLICLPEDRADGTDITLEAEYAMATGMGGAGVALSFRYALFGKGEALPAAAALVRRNVYLVPPVALNTAKAGPIIIPSSEFNGKAHPIEMALVMSRYAVTDPGDIDLANLFLVKVIMRYTANY